MNGVQLSTVGDGSGVVISDTETASIAYTGELLPAGTASYSGISIDPTKRYLKNSGKDKTPALVESGQGKMFNGNTQYIDTGATPNDTEGTFITRFTYVSGSVKKIMVGMNYSDNPCYIGINASGKIGVGFGANTYDTLFSPDVLVAGQSYHVAFRYSGSTYWLFVDNVLKVTGTITGLTSFIGTSFFIGALNNGGTASNYFNSVIGETYYYDVALPDTAIQSLYLYPEKVKEYNGAIVPDIGYEANCKLFLPLCENSGSNVVNVAVAKQDESYYNETVNMATSDGGGGGEVSVLTSLGSGSWNLKVTTVGTNIGSPFITVNGTRPLETISKTIDIEFDAVVTSGNCYITKFHNGAIQIPLTTPYLIKNGHNVLTVQTRASNSAVAYLYLDGTKLFDVSISNITSKASVSYPLTSYTTAMHTSAAKLSYGAQCTAWKRDSLGVLLGMSDKMQFDNLISTKAIDTGWIVKVSDNFVLETIMYFKNEARFEQQGAYLSSTDRFLLGKNSTDNRARLMVNANSLYSNAFHDVLGYRHLIVKKVGTSVEFIVDGISCGTTTMTVDTTVKTMRVGGTDSSSYMCLSPLRYWKKHLSTVDTTKLYNKAKRKLYQDVIPANIVLVGDSTVTSSLGWGGQFSTVVKPEYSVINKAYSGESSKSFIDKGLWELAKRYGAKYYLIQFGHNDSKVDPVYTTDAQTTYKDYLRIYVNEARAIGGTPILVTPMLRANFTANIVNLPDTRNYAEAMVEVATEMNVPCILLNWKSETKYNELGQATINAMQPLNDTTHWLTTGATMLCGLIREEMVRLNLPIAN